MIVAIVLVWSSCSKIEITNMENGVYKKLSINDKQTNYFLEIRKEMIIEEDIGSDLDFEENYLIMTNNSEMTHETLQKMLYSLIKINKFKKIPEIIKSFNFDMILNLIISETDITTHVLCLEILFNVTKLGFYPHEIFLQDSIIDYFFNVFSNASPDDRSLNSLINSIFLVLANLINDSCDFCLKCLNYDLIRICKDFADYPSSFLVLIALTSSCNTNQMLPLFEVFEKSLKCEDELYNKRGLIGILSILKREPCEKFDLTVLYQLLRTFLDPVNESRCVAALKVCTHLINPPNIFQSILELVLLDPDFDSRIIEYSSCVISQFCEVWKSQFPQEIIIDFIRQIHQVNYSTSIYLVNCVIIYLIPGNIDIDIQVFEMLIQYLEVDEIMYNCLLCMIKILDQHIQFEGIKAFERYIVSSLEIITMIDFDQNEELFELITVYQSYADAKTS